MDQTALFLRIMRKEFGNLLSAARIKTVTIASVDLPTHTAVVDFAQGDAADPVPEQQTVAFLRSYLPIAGETAYLLLAEGAPVLIGAVEDSAWTDFTLPTGYTSGGLTLPGYRKQSDGRVFLRGACNVAAGNAAGVKFNVPAGYRPTSQRTFEAPFSNGTSITGHFRYNVESDGDISTAAAFGGATQLVMFEGVSWDIR